MLALALAAAAGASALAAWLLDRRGSGLRNELGRCAACDSPWAETRSDQPYLIQGRLVCEGCATKAKRRIPLQFGVLTAAAAFATVLLVSAEGLIAMVLFPAATTVVMTLAAVQLMKVANRNAQRRIVAGDFPELDALRASDEGSEALQDSSARPDAVILDKVSSHESESPQ